MSKMVLLKNLSVILLIIPTTWGRHTSEYTNKALVTVSGVGDTKVVNAIVGRYGLKYLRQILPTVHEYELTTANLTKKLLKEMKLNRQIFDIYMEENISLPVEKPRSKSQQFLKHLRKRSLRDLLICSPYYGMDIMNAWGLGYRGHGVTVGVVDTGIEVTHADLAPNIDINLSHNFVSGQSETDVSPDILPSYQELDIYSDHGNNCAGLIAAVQCNQVCSSGVAPDANIAALKFLELKDPTQSTDRFRFRPAELIDALAYRNDKIDIYSNSYGPGEDFAKSSVVVNEAFKTGATQGRNRKGSIYVVAAGNKGNYKDANLDGYVNSIYTISISSVGVNDTIPKFAQPGACIVASTYGEGLNKFDRHMVTTSHRNSCTEDFKRTSASAAIASGIIALALQANKDLTWRDVQHLIINTSSVADLEGHDRVITNSVGLKYHPFFGFGLMNASALVNAAKHWITVPKQKLIQASAIIRNGDKQKPVHIVSLEVCKESPHCLSFTEHVVAYIEYISYCDKSVELELCAPSTTCSLLLKIQHVRRSSPTKRVKRKWNFMSLQFWGEVPNGTWVLNMHQNNTGVSYKDKRFTIIRFNLTVYGYSEGSSGVYEEIEQYASRKVDELAEVLDIEIPAEEKGTFNKIIVVIGQVFAGAGFISFLMMIIYFMPVETRFHMRQTCLNKCQQLWNVIRTFCGNVYERITHLPHLFYERVNDSL